MKVTDLKNDELVNIYIQLRDRRAQRKAAYDNDDASDKAKQEKIEGILLARFAHDGVESIRTAAGTAFKDVRTSASVADADMYFDWVLADPEERRCFLEARANKTAVSQYKAANEDLPPGINWREEVTIKVRRA